MEYNREKIDQAKEETKFIDTMVSHRMKGIRWAAILGFFMMIVTVLIKIRENNATVQMKETWAVCG
ncbi:hypothetical protein [Alteribacter aurantiacus]|uniref:hypothetical protein n=1 Tax=Alteribacter aurantiacus TaxID=254410 RepID=UPI0003F86C6D|nr:hypothetical protein [Alteribacter aurantiacus]